VHVERQLIPSRLNEIKCVEEFRPGGFHKLGFGGSSTVFGDFEGRACQSFIQTTE
ncbi:hypothetical protein BJV77DRAFT_1037172, partial [Russula vinacea]